MSSQHYIIIIVMASFMRVTHTLMFHQSKCISGIKRILRYYSHISTLVFFHELFFFLVAAMNA